MTSPAAGDRPERAWVVWLAAAVLFVLHQDLWLWDDRTLVFGFLPVGLAYHALFSVAAGVLWALAVRLAWPSAIERWAEQGQDADADEDANAL